MQTFHADIFDDGISSTDARKGKFDGGIFHELDRSEIFPDFDIFSNLHIGDNLHSDVKMARFAGSNVAHYWPHRNRRFREKIGARKLVKNSRKSIYRDRKIFREELKLKTDSPREIWRKYGELFSQPLFGFLLHIGISARNSPEAQFLMVSSEAKMFKKFGDELFPRMFSEKNIVVADKLNRKMILRALIYFFAKNPNAKFNADVIFKTIGLGEIGKSRREVYEFFFGEDFTFSELELNDRNEKDFAKAFLYDVSRADEKSLAKIRESYEYVLKIFREISDIETVIVDVGWGGTVQVLFNEFVKLHGSSVKISGLYLGCHPSDRFPVKPLKMRGYLMPNVRDSNDRNIWNAVLWEYAYTNKAQFPEDFARLREMQKGFLDGMKLFVRMENDPKELFREIWRPKIRDLITNPTKSEIETIGSIGFDSGFVEKNKFFILPQESSKIRFKLRLIRHPKRTLRNEILFMNSWPAGIIRYYGLTGIKTFLRILGKIRGKRYI